MHEVHRGSMARRQNPTPVSVIRGLYLFEVTMILIPITTFPFFDTGAVPDVISLDIP